MKLLQINSVLNKGSTGRIMEGIGIVAKAAGCDSYAAYSILGSGGTQLQGIPIGSNSDRYLHGLKTRTLDRHGFGSRSATETFIEQVKEINPDVIGLHNLHGYYLNIEVLFNYLNEAQKPVVWTFHDCWPFTGHCTHFERAKCEKWKTHCKSCPLSSYYPKSWFMDRSYKNFDNKRALFTGYPNLTIVTPSQWLKDLVQKSFLKEYPVEVIHNGVDLDVFKPQKHIEDRKIVLGVASIWADRKGLGDFKKLRNELSEKIEIVLIGLNSLQIKDLPKGITGIARTESTEELAKWYSRATVFVNPTYIDNFPTTNIEALACGTPVITYNTGGSPEAINSGTGIVVEKGDIKGLRDACIKITELNGDRLKVKCRERAIKLYDGRSRFQDYVNLYGMIME